MKVIRPIYLGIPVVALLAGCGSAASSAADAGMASAPVNCSSVPLSTVESTLGVSGLTGPKKTTSAIMSACLYTDASTGSSASIQTLSDSSAAKMTAEQQMVSKSEKTAPYPGVGDQAFAGTIAAGPMTVNTLVVRKGTTQVTITSSAKPAAEKNLAEKVLSGAG